MKKRLVLLAAGLSLVVSMNAQTQVPENTASPIYYNNGNVGIGTSIPSAGLQITNFFNNNGNKVIALLGYDYDHWTYFGGLNAGRIRGSNEGYLVLESNAAGYSDKRLYLNYSSPGDICAAYGGGNMGIGVFPSYKLDVAGDIHFSNNNHSIFLRMGAIGNANYETAIRTRFQDGNGSFMDLGSFAGNSTNFNSFLTITPIGNVVIGNTTQVNSAYKLDVAGSIRANAVVCNTSGADFVFEPTYKLRPLSEVETFIKAHQHLPEIAPAADMQTNGVSMGEMQAKLLQKVEELTLYTIQLQKENTNLNQRLKELESLIREKLK